MTRAPDGERIAVLETEAQARWDQVVKTLETNAEALAKMELRLAELEKKLAAYENKGKGVLIGAGLFGASVGVAALAAVERILGFFK